MNKNHKKHKLGNAIRAWKGTCCDYRLDLYKPKSRVAWKVPPQQKAIKRVIKWLTVLNMDVSESIRKINTFKSWHEYDAWIETV